MLEYRVFGPPGTGKTNSLARNVANAVERFNAASVMVASFTRAAAAEAISRIDNANIPRNQVGTLHSICYHALGEPKVAELKLSEFNEEHPEIAISSGSADPDDPMSIEAYGSPSQGDKLLQRLSLERTRLTPREAWPETLESFADIWQDWKKQTGYLDFTDLLEIGLRDMDRAPGDPQVGFFDEAQDFTALQFAIVRKWAERMAYCVFYGDDDQTLYSWSGADPTHLINDDIPPDHKRVLRQSYRLPAAIHALSDTWIKQCSTRYDKEWSPTKAEGWVERLPASHFKSPGQVLDLIEQHLGRGRSAMLLATCGYMLAPAIAMLRERGLAFHNPYRKNRGDWNPWNTAGGSTVGRIISFLRADQSGLSYDWTYADLHRWAGLIRAKGCLRHGGKKKIAEKAKQDGKLKADHYFLSQVLGEGPWDDPFTPWAERERLFSWLERNVTESRKNHLGYVIRALRKDPGLLSPHRRPRITVGTVHSVKGGEADVVCLFPDLSREATQSWRIGGEARDSVIRTFYVGMTRAKQGLILPANHGPLYVRM